MGVSWCKSKQYFDVRNMVRQMYKKRESDNVDLDDLQDSVHGTDDEEEYGNSPSSNSSSSSRNNNSSKLVRSVNGTTMQ